MADDDVAQLIHELARKLRMRNAGRRHHAAPADPLAELRAQQRRDEFWRRTQGPRGIGARTRPMEGMS